MHRINKGDHVIEFQSRFVIESKSLQSGMVEKDGDTWRGRAQVDASDRRSITLEDETQIETTLREFDVLAVNCFAFEQEWKFVFARNSDLPRCTYSRYSSRVRDQLIASLVQYHGLLNRHLQTICEKRNDRECFIVALFSRISKNKSDFF